MLFQIVDMADYMYSLAGPVQRLRLTYQYYDLVVLGALAVAALVAGVGTVAAFEKGRMALVFFVAAVVQLPQVTIPILLILITCGVLFAPFSIPLSLMLYFVIGKVMASTTVALGGYGIGQNLVRRWLIAVPLLIVAAATHVLAKSAGGDAIAVPLFGLWTGIAGGVTLIQLVSAGNQKDVEFNGLFIVPGMILLGVVGACADSYTGVRATALAGVVAFHPSDLLSGSDVGLIDKVLSADAELGRKWPEIVDRQNAERSWIKALLDDHLFLVALVFGIAVGVLQRFIRDRPR